jgi:hypothetical protein
MRKRTDKQLLDGLDRMVRKGSCPGLINDDNGHWAVSEAGIQNVVTGAPKDVQTTFFISAKQWRRSVRAAINAYLNECNK